MNYDPNLVYCGRMAEQKVRLTFGQWDYRKTVETVVGGNCRGLEVIDCAVDNVYEDLDSDMFENKEILLTKDDGEELLCSDDEGEDMNFLKNMLIAAEIIDIKPDEIRRCRVCGCTDDDCRQCIEKTGEPCYWVEEDLCSACAGTVRP
jgi:hypothetical protein